MRWNSQRAAKLAGLHRLPAVLGLKTVLAAASVNEARRNELFRALESATFIRHCNRRHYRFTLRVFYTLCFGWLLAR